MSTSTLDDIAEQEVLGGSPTLGNMPTEDFETIEQQPSRMGEMFQRLLTAETGAGSIDSYIDHPMNFSKSIGLAQLIRGLTGIIGNLDLAIIDVAFGAFRFSKEKGGVVNASNESDGVLIR